MAAWLGFWWVSLIDQSLVHCNVQSQQLPSCIVCSQLFQSDGTLYFALSIRNYGNLRGPIGVDGIDGVLTKIEALCSSPVHAQHVGTPAGFGTATGKTVFKAKVSYDPSTRIVKS